MASNNRNFFNNRHCVVFGVIAIVLIVIIGIIVIISATNCIYVTQNKYTWNAAHLLPEVLRLWQGAVIDLASKLLFLFTGCFVPDLHVNTKYMLLVNKNKNKISG